MPARKRARYNLLATTEVVRAPVITYVRSDFRDEDLLRLLNGARRLNTSPEYTLFSGFCQNREVVLLGTGSGASNALTPLCEMVGMPIGAIVRVGATGGRNCELNEVVVAESAYTFDAVSSRLLSSARRVYPSKGLADRIGEELRADGLKSGRYPVTSVEAMYLCEREVKRGERAGAYCWDLETATVLAYGKRFRIPAASVLLVVSGKGGRSMAAYPPIQRLDFVASVMKAVAGLPNKGGR